MMIRLFFLIALSLISLQSAHAQSTPPHVMGECRFDTGQMTGPASGDINFLTDLASPDTANGMFNLPVPASCGLPAAKLFVTWARVQCDPQVGAQINVSIDRFNNGYNTGTGLGHQTGIDDSLMLDVADIQPNENPYHDVRKFDPPKIWNRTGAPNTPTDRLWFNADLPPGVVTYCAFNIGFLQDNTVAITAANPGPPSPPPSWTNIAGPATLNADTGNYAGYTLCQTIAASAITDKPGATQTGVTIQGAAGASLTVDKLFEGPSAGSSNPCDATSLTQLMFPGTPPSASVTLSGGATAMGTVSSNIVPSATGLVIKMHVTSGNFRYAASVPGWQAYYAAGDSAATISGTTYTAAGAQAIGVVSVEKE
jgi:hypothetical protein